MKTLIVNFISMANYIESMLSQRERVCGKIVGIYGGDAVVQISGKFAHYKVQLTFRTWCKRSRPSSRISWIHSKLKKNNGDTTKLRLIIDLKLYRMSLVVMMIWFILMLEQPTWPIQSYSNSIINFPKKYDSDFSKAWISWKESNSSILSRENKPS